MTSRANLWSANTGDDGTCVGPCRRSIIARAWGYPFGEFTESGAGRDASAINALQYCYGVPHVVLVTSLLAQERTA